MEGSKAQKLARVLKILVTIVFVCNLIALFLVPGLAFSGGDLTFTGYSTLGKAAALIRYFANCWGWPLWLVLLADTPDGAYFIGIALFLLFCGVCTAVILWQARRVLGTICARNPFCLDNAVNLRRAAVCCFLISAAALARTCWGFWFYRSIRPLLTYNALFVPVFLLGGLLCMVMSALFRQAAELKAENDLTI